MREDKQNDVMARVCVMSLEWNMTMDVKGERDCYVRDEKERGVEGDSWSLWLRLMGAYEEVGRDPYVWLGEEVKAKEKSFSQPEAEVFCAKEEGKKREGGGMVFPSQVPHGEGGYDSECLAGEVVKGCRTLADVRSALEEFSPGVLEELRGGATNLVYVDGVEKAEVLVIGEAPGRDEDREGKPFVGRSGRLLDKVLGSVGLSRERNVLVSNVVYWRPPGNRNPTRSEVMACRPFVEKTIELVDPDIIVLTGSVPVGAVLQTHEPVGRLRGKWCPYRHRGGRDYEVLVTFHPSYLLRSPKMKSHAWRDMVTLKKRREEKEGRKG